MAQGVGAGPDLSAVSDMALAMSTKLRVMALGGLSTQRRADAEVYQRMPTLAVLKMCCASRGMQRQ